MRYQLLYNLQFFNFWEISSSSHKWNTTMPVSDSYEKQNTVYLLHTPERTVYYTQISHFKAVRTFSTHDKIWSARSLQHEESISDIVTRGLIHHDRLIMTTVLMLTNALHFERHINSSCWKPCFVSWFRRVFGWEWKRVDRSYVLDLWYINSTTKSSLVKEHDQTALQNRYSKRNIDRRISGRLVSMRLRYGYLKTV